MMKMTPVSLKIPFVENSLGMAFRVLYYSPALSAPYCWPLILPWRSALSEKEAPAAAGYLPGCAVTLRW
jgi:hypothetical protein